MLWIIGFFTVVLVLDSLFLILLVLVQLPKKEAGLGQAFGASATDALFGAGSGNALTKMTKYSTGIFFALTLVIYLMYNHQARSRSGDFSNRVKATAPVEPIEKRPSSTGTNLITTTATNVAATNAAITNVSTLLSAPKSTPSETTAP